MTGSLRAFSASFLRKYPCCGAFLVISVVTVPFLLQPESPFPLLMIPASFFLILAGFFVSPTDLIVRLAIPSFLAACSVLLHQYLYQTDDLSAAFAHGPGRAEAVIRIDDTAASPGFSVPGEKKNWKVHVLSLQKEGCPAETVSSSAMAVIPSELCTTAGYGDILRVSAVFLRPNEVLTERAFDYKNYLSRQMIFYCLKVEEVSPVSRGTGPIRFLLDCRDKLLNVVCGPLPEDIRYLASGMLFGVRTGITPGTKRDFLSSGMVHILSVSGTHVMMFSVLFLLLLAPLPMRPRYLSVIALTLLYALSTGMKEPAYRAFIMFSLFLGLRAFLLRSIPLNTLSLAACILVIRDPFSLASSGFQFSFLTVAALLLAAPFVRHWFFLPSERMLLIPNRWMPISLIRSEVRRKHRITILASCTTAWLVSLPLSLLYQGIWPGASIFANLLAMPLIGLTFFLFLCAALVCFIPSIFVVILFLLELCLRGIVFCADLFSGFGYSLPFLSVWMAVLFLFLLFLLFQARTVRAILVCLTLCMLSGIFLYIEKFTLPASAVILTDGDHYSAAIVSPALSTSSVIELPDFSAAREMASFLASQGVKHCDVCFHSKGKEQDEAFADFSRQIDVRTSCSCGPGESPYSRIRNVSVFPMTVHTWSGKTVFSLQTPDGFSVTGRFVRLENGGLRIFLRDSRTDRVLLDKEFYPANQYTLISFPLTRN